MSDEMSWKSEFIALFKHLQNKRVGVQPSRQAITAVLANTSDLVDLYSSLLQFLLWRCVRYLPQFAL